MRYSHVRDNASAAGTDYRTTLYGVRCTLTAPTTYESVTKSSTIIPIVKIPGVWIMSSGQFGADLFATKVLVKEAPTPASDQPFILNDDGTAPAKRRGSTAAALQRRRGGATRRTER